MDAKNGEPLINTKISAFSDNGVRCIQAPCPTEGKSWEDTTNSKGIVNIPSSFINSNQASIIIEGSSTIINENNGKFLLNGKWVIDIVPKTKDSILEKRIKLLDSDDKTPLKNISFSVTTTKDCVVPECSNIKFSGKTDSLGNYFFPKSDKEQGLVTGNWVSVEGYKNSEYTSRGGNDIAVPLSKK